MRRQGIVRKWDRPVKSGLVDVVLGFADVEGKRTTMAIAAEGDGC